MNPDIELTKSPNDVEELLEAPPLKAPQAPQRIREKEDFCRESLARGRGRWWHEQDLRAEGRVGPW